MNIHENDPHGQLSMRRQIEQAKADFESRLLNQVPGLRKSAEGVTYEESELRVIGSSIYTKVRAELTGPHATPLQKVVDANIIDDLRQEILRHPQPFEIEEAILEIEDDGTVLTMHGRIRGRSVNARQPSLLERVLNHSAVLAGVIEVELRRYGNQFDFDHPELGWPGKEWKLTMRLPLDGEYTPAELEEQVRQGLAQGLLQRVRLDQCGQWAVINTCGIGAWIETADGKSQVVVCGSVLGRVMSATEYRETLRCESKVVDRGQLWSDIPIGQVVVELDRPQELLMKVGPETARSVTGELRTVSLVQNVRPWSELRQGQELEFLPPGRTKTIRIRKVSQDLAVDDQGKQVTVSPDSPCVIEPARYLAVENRGVVAGREITTHRVNGLNENLSLRVLDEPGAGGACHLYQVWLPVANAPTTIQFQNGSIKEQGVNGLSNEVLLAILIHRMEGFQSGKFACHDNQMALDHLQAARLWLAKRTLDRIRRNVEGTHQP